jgi:hypothetical protein
MANANPEKTAFSLRRSVHPWRLSLAANVATVPIKGAMPACARRPCAASVQAQFQQSSQENHASF